MRKIFAWMLTAVMILSLTACTEKITFKGVAIEDIPAINVGESVKLNPVFETESDASLEKIDRAVAELELVWKSTDEKVAVVDENGNVTAVAVGKADITLTAGELTTTVSVTVNDPAQAIEIDDIELQLGGEPVNVEIRLTEEISPDDITYSIVDESIATVDESGTIKAVSVGETELIVKINDIEKVVKVTVTEAQSNASSSSGNNNVTSSNGGGSTAQTSGGQSSTGTSQPSTTTPAPQPSPEPAPQPSPEPAPQPSTPVDNGNQNVGDTHNPGYSDNDFAEWE